MEKQKEGYKNFKAFWVHKFSISAPLPVWQVCSAARTQTCDKNKGYDNPIIL
ncbi:MAG: hypothetical protein K2N63_04075 [Lachnospiraceae bacterium]|nr:hypothetical protein [Lachnospiraceae bacterium]